MSDYLARLEEAIRDDEPIEENDDELMRLAIAATEELRRRYPRYALDAGDLEDEDEVDRREAAAIAARILRGE